MDNLTRVVFERVIDGEGNPTISATLMKEDGDNCIETKWAHLCIRYADQLMKEFPITDQPHIEDVGATIYFSRNEIIENPCEEGFTEQRTDREVENSIGFALDTRSAYLKVGGMTTPSVVLSHHVYKALSAALGRVSV